VREEQNWVGGANPCSAAFVPPPRAEILTLLEDLAEYLIGDEHPALLQAALPHAQFETIHPCRRRRNDLKQQGSHELMVQA